MLTASLSLCQLAQFLLTSAFAAAHRLRSVLYPHATSNSCRSEYFTFVYERQFKAIQHAPSSFNQDTSPHEPITDYYLITCLLESPDKEPPLTSDADIPHYYTAEYQAKRRTANFHEAEIYQGLFSGSSEEHSLQSQWSNLPSIINNTTDEFNLCSYLDTIFVIKLHLRESTENSK